MIRRTLAPLLRRAATRHPILTLTGPRQSGKTTLVRSVFPRHAYVSLETPEDRLLALEDPRGFLARYPGPVVLDEVQRAPDLFSYLQTSVDLDPRPGRYVLSGSQNFLLLEKISQSLAGRTVIFHLLPLSAAELSARRPLSLETLGRVAPRHPGPIAGALDAVLLRGGFPRLADPHMPPAEWLGSYVQTYLERDVRALLGVGDLETYARFLRLCAGRSGQILNLSALASDCGISQPTARSWLSVLQSSFLVHLLPPHAQGFRKRLVRSPKLYLTDSGLLCYLLGIRSSQELAHHGTRGAIFETYVVTELLKGFHNRGEAPALFFWRDNTGHEVDLVVDFAGASVPIEIKAGATIAEDTCRGLRYWLGLKGDEAGPAMLVYGGEASYLRKGIATCSWAGL